MPYISPSLMMCYKRGETKKTVRSFGKEICLGCLEKRKTGIKGHSGMIYNKDINPGNYCNLTSRLKLIRVLKSHLFLTVVVSLLFLTHRLKGGREINMATLKEQAKVFVPQQVKNIAELPSVSVDWQLEDREGTNQETGEIFKYKVVQVNGMEYRVPGKVIGDLKAILEKKPNLKTFSVTKKGEGLKTQYTVIPMD